MKTIWIFNHYATKGDEPATRAFDFSRELVSRGYKVTIFASAFSHYKLKTKYLTDHEAYKEEMVDGVRFFWIRSVAHRKNDIKRLLNMLSYSWRAFWLALRQKEKPDAVIGTSVHPFAVLIAYYIACIKKSRFFFEVTDLWPQTLIDMGLLKEQSFATFVLRFLEKFLYERAEKIITFWPYAVDYIVTLGIPKDKVVWIPNGIDTKRYESIKPYVGGNKNNFVFMYTGIHAQYANLDVVLKAAEIIQKKGEKNIKFIFVGDGLEKQNLIQMAKDLQLQNVQFHDMVPKDKVFQEIEKADALISIIKDMPVLRFGTSSNKLNDYLISGRPIVFAVKSTHNPVRQAKAGLTVKPGSPHLLAETVLKMYNLTPQERIKMGENGITYVKKYYDISILVNKLEKILA